MPGGVAIPPIIRGVATPLRIMGEAEGVTTPSHNNSRDYVTQLFQ